MGIAAGIKDIVQDIVSSREARLAGEAARKSEAQQLRGVRVAEVKRLKKEANESREVRVAEVEGLKKEANEMLDSFKASNENRKSEVHVMLNDFQGSRQQMGAEQRKLLADYDRGIKSEVAGMRQETIADLRRIKSEVAGMRQETIADLREARTAWQSLASNGHAKRGGAQIIPEKEALVGKEEFHDMEAKLLAAVIEHPKGITLTEAADELGIAAIALGRASKGLLDKNLIRKKHKHYVPASAK